MILTSDTGPKSSDINAETHYKYNPNATVATQHCCVFSLAHVSNTIFLACHFTRVFYPSVIATFLAVWSANLKGKGLCFILIFSSFFSDGSSENYPNKKKAISVMTKF